MSITTGDDCSANVENEWSELTLLKGGMKFQTKGNCARCSMVDFDPKTGKKGKTLRALAQYRRENGQITFGIFLKAISMQSATGESWIEEGSQLVCTYNK